MTFSTLPGSVVLAFDVSLDITGSLDLPLCTILALHTLLVLRPTARFAPLKTTLSTGILLSAIGETLYPTGFDDGSAPVNPVIRPGRKSGAEHELADERIVIKRSRGHGSGDHGSGDHGSRDLRSRDHQPH